MASNDRDQTLPISMPSFDLTFLLIFNQFHPLTSITIYFPVYVLDMFIASDLLVPWRRPTYYYIYTANGNISFVRRDAILQADLKLHRYTHAKSCLIQHLDNTILVLGMQFNFAQSRCQLSTACIWFGTPLDRDIEEIKVRLYLESPQTHPEDRS